jgi:hypothetical protein
MGSSAAGEAESVGGLSLGSGSVVAARPIGGVSSNIAKDQRIKHSVSRRAAALKRRANVLIPPMSSYNDHPCCCLFLVDMAHGSQSVPKSDCKCRCREIDEIKVAIVQICTSSGKMSPYDANLLNLNNNKDGMLFALQLT